MRTPEEWTFIGVPDLAGLDKGVVFVPWTIFPDKLPNSNFEEHISEHTTGKAAALLFLCRSGVRLRNTAIATRVRGYGRCYDVANGFEGPKGDLGHRAAAAGWKVDGLVWKQN